HLEPSAALVKLGEVNMGDPAVLKDFIAWSKKNYPAKHYMLEFWSHGQGWRMQMLESRIAALQSRFNLMTTPTSTRPVSQAFGNSFRSVSPDDSSEDQLYMREVQDA